MSDCILGLSSRPALSQSQDQEIRKTYLVQKRRATDFRVPKLWKGRSATWAYAFSREVINKRAFEESFLS